MSPASLVAEATTSRAIPRSKHGLDLAEETGSAVVTWTKTKYRYPLSPRFFPVSLTTNPLFQQDAHRIIRRRAKAAGVETRIGNHTFRATGITAYLKNSGKLESSAADR